MTKKLHTINLSIIEFEEHILKYDLETFGAFMQLLFYQFKHGELPGDDLSLSRILKCHFNKWLKIKQKLEESGELCQIHLEVTSRSLQGHPIGHSLVTCKSLLSDVEVKRRKSMVSKDTTTPNKNKNKDKNQDKNNKKETKEKAGDLYSPEFEKFWKLYPRKISKGLAYRSYLKAIKKVDHEEISDALTNHLQHWRQTETETQFIKHPSSWLNAECWTDEIEPKKSVAEIYKIHSPAGG